MANDSDARSMIVVSGRFMHELTDEAIEAMMVANNPPTVFVHGDVLTRIRSDKNLVLVVLEPLSHAALKGLLDRAAAWVSVDAKGNTHPARPPGDVVSDFRAMDSWPGFPPVEGVVHAPVVASDGSIHSERGYSPATRVYLDLPVGLKVPKVPDVPTRQQIAAELPCSPMSCLPISRLRQMRIKRMRLGCCFCLLHGGSSMVQHRCI